MTLRTFLPVLLLLMGCESYPATTTCSEDIPASLTLSCDDATEDYLELLGELRACVVPADCGSIIKGGGCGCRNSIPARKNVEDRICEYDALLAQRASSCEDWPAASTCVCEPYLGFGCVEGRCKIL